MLDGGGCGCGGLWWRLMIEVCWWIRGVELEIGGYDFRCA